jgi:hypothetical protein
VRQARLWDFCVGLVSVNASNEMLQQNAESLFQLCCGGREQCLDLHGLPDLGCDGLKHVNLQSVLVAICVATCEKTHKYVWICVSQGLGQSMLKIMLHH